MNNRTKNIITRGLTALVFVPTVLAGLFGGKYAYSLLFLVVLVACSLEYYELLFPKGEERQHRFRKYYGVFLSCILYVVVAFNYLFINFGFEVQDLTVLLLFLAFFSFIYELFRESESPFTNISLSLSGILYIGVPMTFVLFLGFGHTPAFDSKLVIALIVMNWLNDTGAYLVGSFFGKTPLFPRISPKKTWEGTIGGVTFAFVTGYIFSLFYTKLGLQLWDWFALAAIVAIFGNLGDLVESMLKRSTGVKDSGKFLPGHGGMLDRFDAFIFLLPFAAAYVYFVG